MPDTGPEAEAVVAGNEVGIRPARALSPLPRRRVKATRVMTARHESTCPICQAPASIGAQIGLTRLGWCHTECIVLAAQGSLWETA